MHTEKKKKYIENPSFIVVPSLGGVTDTLCRIWYFYVDSNITCKNPTSFQWYKPISFPFSTKSSGGSSWRQPARKRLTTRIYLNEPRSLGFQRDTESARPTEISPRCEVRIIWAQIWGILECMEGVVSSNCSKFEFHLLKTLQEERRRRQKWINYGKQRHLIKIVNRAEFLPLWSKMSAQSNLCQ